MGERATGDGRWRVRGVSMPGYSHLRDGIEVPGRLPAHVRTHERELRAGRRRRRRQLRPFGRGRDPGGRARGRGVPRTPGPGRACRARRTAGISGSGDGFGGSSSTRSSTTTARFGRFARGLRGDAHGRGPGAPPHIGDSEHRRRDRDRRGSRAANGAGGAAPRDVHAAGRRVRHEAGSSSPRRAPRARGRTQVVDEPELTSLLLATDGHGARRGGDATGPRCARTTSSWTWCSAELSGERPDPAAVPRLLLEDRVSRRSADDKTLLAVMRT